VLSELPRGRTLSGDGDADIVAVFEGEAPTDSVAVAVCDGVKLDVVVGVPLSVIVAVTDGDVDAATVAETLADGE
jgi:hypothetical protein